MWRGRFLETPIAGAQAVVLGDHGARTGRASVALVVDGGGRVLACGDNSYGQMGI
jgi:Regulator of chromosome condensation (RCC1) repeat